MSANPRMSMVEAALAQQGVRDVKFFFNVSASQATSEVNDSVCNLLEQYLAGKFSKMDAVGDAIAV